MLPPDILNAPAAADYIGVKKARIYQLAKAKRLGQQIAGYWLFSRDELDRYIEVRATRPRGGRPSRRTA